MEFELVLWFVLSFDVIGLFFFVMKGSNMVLVLYVFINGDYVGVYFILGYLGLLRGLKLKRNFFLEYFINGGMVLNYSWLFWRVGESSYCRDIFRCV